MRSLNNPALNKKLESAWGELRETTGDKRESIVRWKNRLTRDQRDGGLVSGDFWARAVRVPVLTVNDEPASMLFCSRRLAAARSSAAEMFCG